MPLKQSTSDKAKHDNILAEIHAGKPTAQAVAIGYAIQRDNKRKKGKK